MCAGYDGAYARGYLAHDHTGTSRQTHYVDRLAHVVGSLYQAERHHNTLVCRAVDVHVCGAIVDTHHVIIDRIYAHERPARIDAIGEQGLIDLLSQDTHLAVLVDVHLVDVTAVAQDGRSHLSIIWQDAFQVTRIFLVAINSVMPPFSDHGRHDIKLWHLLSQSLHVLVGHRPLPSLSKAMIRLGGGVRENHSRVCGKAGKLLCQRLLQSVASTYQRHEHEQSPEHAEARKQRAALVARQGIENFAKAINVKIYHRFFVLRNGGIRSISFIRSTSPIRPKDP